MSYARQFGIKVGDTISMAGASFPVVGLADASRAAKIAVANVYVPIEEAQKLAAASSQVQSVSPFSPVDVNLLFIKADQEKISDLASALRNIVDKKATIGTPDSFLKLLGSFCPVRQITMAASLIAIIVAVLIAFKTMAGNIAERAREIGVLKAVGWTNRNVVSQLLAESVIQCFLAGIFGLVLAAIAAFGLLMNEHPIPGTWFNLFSPGGGDQVYRPRLPVHIPRTLAAWHRPLHRHRRRTGGISRSISKSNLRILRHE
jgi:putative ABC transport system permease protein